MYYTDDNFMTTDIDECLNATLNDCHHNATCTNLAGHFSCACVDGYTGNGKICQGYSSCAFAYD